MTSLSQRSFISWLIVIGTVYIGLQYFLNAYTMFCVDDFWFAHRSYEYKSGLPYRDFSPYKTTLGYYFLLIPMLSAKGVIGTLIHAKNTILLSNLIAYTVTAAWLQRYFSRTAILLSFVLILFSDTVLSTSNDIRADLLAYWFALFGLFSLLEKRYILAGIFLGIGFFIAQKVIWYWFACDVALLVYWFAIERKNFAGIIIFNFSTLLMIVAYLSFWSWISSWHVVLNNVFGEAAIMYQLEWYAQFYKNYWTFITTYNPLLFLWPLTIVSLFVRFSHDATYNKRFFITIFSLTVLALLIPYKQLFPYYLQISIPVLIVLFSVFFTWLQQALSAPALYSKKKYVLSLLIIYSLALVAVLTFLHLPAAYYLILALPILIGLFVGLRNDKRLANAAYFSSTIFAIIFLTGTFYPSILFFKKIYRIDGSYQKANIKVINQLLTQPGGYVAGVEFIYDKSQPIPGLKHLMLPAAAYLKEPSKKLRTVMLASLDEDPNVTSEQVISSLQHTAVKFYVNNYRMQELPDNIKNYLQANYTHWWGSIYLYAPSVAAGKQQIHLKFSGPYLIEAKNSGAIILNNKTIKTGTTVNLVNGIYLSNSSFPYRLKLINDSMELSQQFSADQWQKMI